MELITRASKGGELEWSEMDGDLNAIGNAINTILNAGYINQTQAQALIANAIQAVIGAAPAALDTLQEIAAQLANDESAVSALTTLVSQKANISSLPSAATSTVAGLLLLAAGQTSNQLSKVATTGNYSDLNGLPDLPSTQIQSDWNQNNPASLDYIKNKPTFSGGSSSSSSAMTLISTQSLSSGSCQFTGLSGYNRYKLVVSNINSSGYYYRTVSIQMGYGSPSYYVSSGYVNLGFIQQSTSTLLEIQRLGSGVIDNFADYEPYWTLGYIDTDILINSNKVLATVRASSDADGSSTIPFLSSSVTLSQPCTAIKISGYNCTLTDGTASLYGISQ
jgi:hypothetical protein